MTVYSAEPIDADDVRGWADLPVLRVESNGDHVADNNARASFAARTLAVRADFCGVDEPEVMIADLLNDLRHLCDAIDLDFETLVDHSEVYYNAEIQGEV